MGGIALKGIINPKNEKDYTEESKLNDAVYADIVSISPTDGTVDAGKKTAQSYTGFFCICEILDGGKLSAYITSTNYEQYIAKGEYSWDIGTMPDSVAFDIPLRIHGKITDKKRIDSSSNYDELLFEINKAEQLTVDNGDDE